MANIAQKMSNFRRFFMPKKQLATALSFCFLSFFINGCVSSPAEYFESVSQQTKAYNASKKTAGQQNSKPTNITAALNASPPSPGNKPPDKGNIQASNSKPQSLTPDNSGQDELPSANNQLAGNNNQSTAYNEQINPSAFQAASNSRTFPNIIQNNARPIQAPSITGNPASTANPSQTFKKPFLASLLPNTTEPETLETPEIDPLEQAAEQRIPTLYSAISHGQCKSGWGPKPKKIGATRILPDHKYYIEIRMRQTPLMPVGHTYVAYGRLNDEGTAQDEKLIMLAPFGGYIGAAIASGLPMPGVLTPHPDDCRISPDLAYRVSLNAQNYEKLLTEIQKAKMKKPSYLLFSNNCNHFMTRIAGSVGIKPPKNIYVPAVQYLHDMIEANEGIRIARF